MGLGQKVEFKKYLKKCPLRVDNTFYKEITLEHPKVGIIAGKRVLPTRVTRDYDGPEFDKKVTVFLIACDLKGFYRVPIDCAIEISRAMPPV